MSKEDNRTKILSSTPNSKGGQTIDSPTSFSSGAGGQYAKAVSRALEDRDNKAALDPEGVEPLKPHARVRPFEPSAAAAANTQQLLAEKEIMLAEDPSSGKGLGKNDGIDNLNLFLGFPPPEYPYPQWQSLEHKAEWLGKVAEAAPAAAINGQIEGLTAVNPKSKKQEAQDALFGSKNPNSVFQLMDISREESKAVEQAKPTNTPLILTADGFIEKEAQNNSFDIISSSKNEAQPIPPSADSVWGKIVKALGLKQPYVINHSLPFLRFARYAEDRIGEQFKVGFLSNECPPLAAPLAIDIFNVQNDAIEREIALKTAAFSKKGIFYWPVRLGHKITKAMVNEVLARKDEDLFEEGVLNEK